MKRRIVPLLLLLACSAGAAETAQSLMTAAAADAGSSHRNILIVFHASWCEWCKRFDAMLADAKTGPVLKRHFVIARIDVLERDEKISLNTPGGDQVLAATGGKDQGLPFLAVVDSASKLIVNSLRQPGNENIGYPYEPEEIAWFMTMLKRSAPNLETTEAALVEKWLRAR